MALKALSGVTQGASRFARLPNGFTRSSKLTQTLPIDGVNKASIRVVIGTTAVGTGVFNRSATTGLTIGVSASGQQTDQQHFGTATVGVVISSTASASVTSTHSGTATASIVITTTAAGETGATHSGTANIGVTISATASGTASFIHSGTATVSVAITTSANLVNTVDYLEDETPTPTVTFKADDLSLSNGDYVTNWSGYSRSGTGMGTYVSNARNGYPSVAGNGYEASGGTGTYSENGDISCFVVMKGTSGFFLQNDNGQKGFQIGTSGVRSKSGSNSSWTTPFGAGFNTDEWGIYEVHAGNNGDPDMYSYKNVVDNLVNSSNTAYQTPNWTDNSSNDKGLNIPVGCEIAEFRFWTRELTTSERTALYEYLQTKYNLSGGIAKVSVSISASADGSTYAVHSGTATVSVAVTASASGNAFTAHSGTASCQVNLSASASGTASTPVLDNDYAVSCDGTDDYIDLNSNFSSVFDSDFSVAFWINLPEGQPSGSGFGTGSNPNIFGLSNSGNAHRFFGLIGLSGASDAGKLRVYYKAGGTQVHARSASAFFSSGATGWVHVVVTVEEGSDGIKMYKNGSAVSVDEASNSMSSVTMSNFAGNVDMVFGASNRSGTPNYETDADFDEIAIFNTALSSSQVSTIYNSGDAYDLDGHSNLEGWWRMEEGSGTSVADSSSNSNTATLVNGPTFITSVP